MSEIGRFIVAPVCSAVDAELALQAGADELYCGAMFDEWVEIFGDSDLLSRRQGRLSHLRSKNEMAAIVTVASKYGKPVALTVNARYTRSQINSVLSMIQAWEEVGGHSVLVSDIGILQSLNDRGSRLRRHLSTLVGIFNSSSVAFFAKLGVTRVVLPRDMTLGEIRVLTSRAPDMEYEALAMYQKCEFIDGMCGFYHGMRIPRDGVPAAFDYVREPGNTQPVVWAYDPQYEGHACQMSWATDRGCVQHIVRDDFLTPHCAACMLDDLGKSRVSHFKIAGRAYPSESITRAIRFLREASGGGRALYAATFGSDCECGRCYYRQ